MDAAKISTNDASSNPASPVSTVIAEVASITLAPRSSTPTSTPALGAGPPADTTSGDHSSRSWEWVDAVKVAFKTSDAGSLIPLAGTYLAAAFKAGSTVIEMLETTKGNDEIAKKMEERFRRLSDMLDRVKNASEEPKAVEAIKVLQTELNDIAADAQSLQPHGTTAGFIPGERVAANFEDLKERLQMALQEAQAEANLTTSRIVAELYSDSSFDQLGDGDYGEQAIARATSVWTVAISPDGKQLASGSRDGKIRLWDLQTRSQAGKPLKGHTGLVTSVCFSPDGKLLASGSQDHTIRLWDSHNGNQVGEPLTGHPYWIWAVCFSPDGKLLASGSDDKTIRLWDPHVGNQIGEPLNGHADYVKCVCFSPDGQLLASGSQDKTIRLWDVRTVREVGEPLKGHTHWVRSVCFSPDGKLLASGSEDATIRFWDPRNGSQVGEPLKGHTDSVRSVCFSPDGKLLASGSDDKTIGLWDVRTVRPVGEPLKGHTDMVMSVCFSPDSKLLASGSYDKTIRLWDPRNGSQVGEPLKPVRASTP